MSSIDFLVKLRDAAQMIADACNEQLEKTAPPEAQEHGWNPEAIKWEQAEGAKGLFQAYPARDTKPEQTIDYTNLIADLNQHQGRLNKNGFFYWKFPNGITIGRKPAKR